jgi:hypothetical protein
MGQAPEIIFTNAQQNGDLPQRYSYRKAQRSICAASARQLLEIDFPVYAVGGSPSANRTKSPVKWPPKLVLLPKDKRAI